MHPIPDRHAPAMIVPAGPRCGGGAAWLLAGRLLAARLLVAGAGLILAAPPVAAQGTAAHATGAAAGDPAPAAPADTATVPSTSRAGSIAEAGESRHAGHRTAEQRFEAANTTHDGHLTAAQAETAHMRGVATHFAEIDKAHRGYVTLDEIRAWRAERRAERKANKEKAEKQRG